MGLRSDVNDCIKANLIQDALERLEKYAKKKKKPFMRDYVVELQRRRIQHLSSFNMQLMTNDEFNRQMNRLTAALQNAVRARQDDNNFMIQMCEFKIEGESPKPGKQHFDLEKINNILLDPNIEIVDLDQDSGIVQFKSSRYAFRRLVRAYDSGDLESEIQSKVNYIKTFDENGQEKEVYEFSTPSELHNYEYEIIVILRPKVQSSVMNKTLTSDLVGLGAIVKSVTIFTPETADSSSFVEFISFTLSRLPQQKHLIDKIMQIIRFDRPVLMTRLLKHPTG